MRPISEAAYGVPGASPAQFRIFMTVNTLSITSECTLPDISLLATFHSSALENGYFSYPMTLMISSSFLFCEVVGTTHDLIFFFELVPGFPAIVRTVFFYTHLEYRYIY